MPLLLFLHRKSFPASADYPQHMKISTTQDGFRQYELMVIISGELTDGEFEKELGEIRKLLKESTKGISYEDLWGKRDLAFKIKKDRRGYYVVFNFAAEPKAISEMRTTMKLNPVVLRHLIVTLPDGYLPGHHNDEVIPLEKKDDDNRKRARYGNEEERAPRGGAAPHRDATEKPKLAGKDEEEQLKTVEKKLEKILANPDIDIR